MPILLFYELHNALGLFLKVLGENSYYETMVLLFLLDFCLFSLDGVGF